ncbi:ParB N-terminal domain-containing protein [Rhodobacteraceae bacterium B1Z28]|uniref:ParB N-terminal domain-containing protein n=1 Tax=Ruegeria haliotis TaxID=2747601 RepID=A0ABX2PXL2_9RHOB|nr:ParB/RepB/Spo0J family partition protein [Ruegeria haliotis]NVO58544.1 ParB N-terminal domain-containing protein [Ruegeria haliotis]
MAKRRRLTAPDTAELEQIEVGFAAKPSISPFETKSAAPPIAQVAAEAASLNGMASVTDRVALAQDQGDAARWRDAQDAGLVAQKVPLDQIDADFIRRDRMVEDEEAMAELLESLRVHGLRTPIEVTQDGDGYGLISGFRRLDAFQRLAETDPIFSEIPAFVRGARTGQGAYVSMVEENELRSNLSPYERGRIAALAAGQGVFESTEAAVDVLFAAASKAKRSKVRSFAIVHEALGDLLQHPIALTEKSGLKLASALRDGAQTKLRQALAAAEELDAKSEWALLEVALKETPEPSRDKGRGGRPQQVQPLTPHKLPGGGEIAAEVSSGELRLRIRGRDLTVEEAATLVNQLAKHLA